MDNKTADNLDSVYSVKSVTIAGPIQAGGFSAPVASSFSRPSDNTPYSIGDLIANVTVAGSVVPLTFNAARLPGGTGIVRRVRLKKSGVNVANASFRVHLFRDLPTVTNGDNGALAMSESNYLGAFDVTMDRAFTNGAKGFGVVNVGSDIVFDAAGNSQNLYGLIEARAAYVPDPSEIFTAVLELLRD